MSGAIEIIPGSDTMRIIHRLSTPFGTVVTMLDKVPSVLDASTHRHIIPGTIPIEPCRIDAYYTPDDVHEVTRQMGDGYVMTNYSSASGSCGYLRTLSKDGFTTMGGVLGNEYHEMRNGTTAAMREEEMPLAHEMGVDWEVLKANGRLAVTVLPTTAQILDAAKGV